MPKAPICPYCGVKAILRSGKFGYFWVCPEWPDCDAKVGCHPGTTTPLGTMANAELCEWRKKAHAAFDPLWKKKGRERSAAYKWLAEALGVKVADCHIAMFDVDLCRRTVEVVDERMDHA